MTGLPQGWTLARLDEVTTPRGEKANPSSLGDLPFLGMDHIEAHSANLLGSQPVSELKSAVAVFKSGDLLYGRLRPYLNKVHLAKFDGAASAEFIVFPPQPAIEQRFLQCVLRSPDYRAIADQRSTGDRPRVKFEDVGDYKIPLPPLLEQRRIVCKLDALSTRSTTARSHLTVIEKLVERYKLGFYLEAFSAPREQVELGKIAKVGTGATPKKGVAKYYVNGTVPWVTSGAVNNKRITEPSSFITDTAIEKTNCKVFPAGSLLMAMYGEGKTRGQVARLGIAAATNQALAVIHDLDEALIDSEYLFRFLDSIYLEIRGQAEGGVQPNLSLSKVKSFRVPLPRLDEQREIVGRIETAFARIDLLASEAAKALKLLGRLDQRILAKAFAGELVPQDPDDEPAETLLARIRAARFEKPSTRRRQRSNSQG